METEREEEKRREQREESSGFFSSFFARAKPETETLQLVEDSDDLDEFFDCEEEEDQLGPKKEIREQISLDVSFKVKEFAFLVGKINSSNKVEGI